jgi:predicted DNA-binding transcriptional regulator YafY
MRADRLLKLMMLLQGRGRRTAAALAGELEVSIRTLYRDLRALETSGVPIIAEPGPGGGVALMDDYRTDLTGFTEREAEALFAAGVPGPLAALGMDRHLETALAKLAAGSPSRLKGREEKARRRILLDVESAEAQEKAPKAAGDDVKTIDPLAVLRDAVMASRRVRIVQRIDLGPVRGARIERDVKPYGLVWSGGAWYAIGKTDGRVRVIATAEVTEAEPIAEGEDGGRFDIPEGFDLGDFWKREREYVAAFATSYPVTLKLPLEAVPWLGPPYAAQAAAAIAASRRTEKQDGAPAVELRFSSAEQARSRLAPLGGAAEILAPAELKTALADLGAALVGAHGSR